MTDFLGDAGQRGDHDYESVRVHLTGTDVPMGAGHQPGRHKKIITKFGSETVDNTNPVRPLLPDHAGRMIAWLDTSGGDVVLCDSEAKANQATPAGSTLPGAYTAPWPVRGQQAIWAVQKTANTTCVVNYTADYEE